MPSEVNKLWPLWGLHSVKKGMLHTENLAFKEQAIYGLGRPFTVKVG